MGPLEIKKYPQGILREKCKPIREITEREKVLLGRMLFTMRHFVGIGLAAPQIGIPEKLIVAEVDGTVMQLANPEILKLKGADSMKEGCLSVPDLGVDIERPYEVIVKGLNEKGKVIELKAQGLLARVLQHEIDHLSGKLIIDYLNLLEKCKLRLHARRRSRQYANL